MCHFLVDKKLFHTALFVLLLTLYLHTHTEQHDVKGCKRKITFIGSECLFFVLLGFSFFSGTSKPHTIFSYSFARVSSSNLTS